MQKIFLIAYRDFSIRIRNKTFLISTLLLPIGIVLFYGTIFFFSSNDTDIHRIGVFDMNNQIFPKLKNDANFIFSPLSNKDVESKKTTNGDNEIDACLMVSDTSEQFRVITYNKLGMLTKNKLEDKIQKIVEEKRFAVMAIDSIQMKKIKSPIVIQYTNRTGSEENEIKESMAYGLSFGFGILMYIILTIYGAQVMRGVMEEKTNRIVEVIISSVRPFELLMGKLIGIGMVSILQLCCWGILLGIIHLGLSMFIGIQYLQSASEVSTPLPTLASNLAQNESFKLALTQLSSFNFPLIIGCFIVYFIGGFFLYSSLFASVGAAVGDDPQDVQSLMMPIMMPIFLSFVFLSKSINNPNGTEAVVASMVPFTSPVVMMSRVVFGVPEGVPLWQVILSMGILFATTFLFISLASRIYKIGILLYGKKVGWKEMIQWVFIK